MKIIVSLIDDGYEAVSEKMIKEEGYAHTLFEISKVADVALDEFYKSKIDGPTYYKGEKDG